MKIGNATTGFDLYQSQFQLNQRKPNENGSNFNVDQMGDSSEPNTSSRTIVLRPAEMPTPRNPDQDRDENFTYTSNGELDLLA